MLHTEALDHVNVTSRADAESSAACRLIDRRLAVLTDWRGQVLSTIRSIVRSADPRVGEDWKWRGVPVWACNGIICTGETYRSIVKMTSLTARCSTIPPVCSTPRLTELRAVPSISAKVKRSMTMRS